MRFFLLIFGILIVIAGVVLFALGYFRPKAAGILIETTPASTVFIDGIQAGRTKYESTHEPGEVVVKLIPESTDKPLLPFETKVTLSGGIKTVIRRELAETEAASSGEIISFEKVAGSEISLAVVSDPDAAQISIDGTVRGFTPYKTANITSGAHQITVSGDGFLERSLEVNTQKGYKLIAVVKLASSGEAVASPTPKPAGETKTLVEILSTPTGFLRVRSEPSTQASEVGQVKPGQKFPFISQDEKTGWFKVEYLPGKQGWVTNQYAKKIEEVPATPSPTPKSTSTPKPTG